MIVTTKELEHPKIVETFMPVALKVLIGESVKDINANDLQEMMNSLEWEDDTINGAFCDRYDLGEAIYEGFTTYDIDVWEVLTNIFNHRLSVEKETKELDESILPR